MSASAPFGLEATAPSLEAACMGGRGTLPTPRAVPSPRQPVNPELRSYV